MGSISSVCTKKRIIDVTSQRIFTEEEVNVLRRQWPVMMTNVDQNAVNLFMNLFTINRNLMTKFDFAAGYYFDAEKTLNDARLVYHVRRVYQLVDMIIGALDDQLKYNEVMKMIEGIGEVHMKYKIHTVDFELRRHRNRFDRPDVSEVNIVSMFVGGYEPLMRLILVGFH
ncbi:uncharacterized protein LOC130657343 isoform X2 [Hydractinia symbiolongicarpus]|uniref:uncharacterized protein LOC130657343 isoform X2 n=1 Tax=Hydractinia symbiolongicarpus TaxID=13093 RepID=UPI00254E52E3|nr:uncharacterized protein LOC130657343 isoform X2 [Hydractinia symbiolongicarpus]